jgi:hypothetical protein
MYSIKYRFHHHEFSTVTKSKQNKIIITVRERRNEVVEMSMNISMGSITAMSIQGTVNTC